ncbi:hypothetical protein ABLO26_24715 [Neobacillus sp. 179-J 1A1 HS]|uniref:hypothetical protein n=1 Tax=Neobacillus driksii TaxID=3035913 RepID=UPI0035BBED37
MRIEHETMGLLIGGFSIVIGISFMFVLLLLFSKKRKPFRTAYGLVPCYLLFILAVYHAFTCNQFQWI